MFEFGSRTDVTRPVLLDHSASRAESSLEPIKAVAYERTITSLPTWAGPDDLWPGRSVQLKRAHPSFSAMETVSG
jgi:hypothetical protein